MNANLVDQRLQNARHRVELLSQSTRKLLLEPKLLSIVLEELAIVLEELTVQQEQLALTRQTLEQERQRYWELFEFAPDGYLVTDTRGVIQQANRMAAALLGVQPPFLVGKPLIVFVAKPDRRAFHTRLNQPEALLQRHYWELWLKPRQGDLFLAVVATSAIYNLQQQIVGWRWLLSDLTRAPHSEDQLGSDHYSWAIEELRSRMIQTITHSLRTPMSIIYTAVELIGHPLYPPSQEKKERYFQNIQTAIQAMIKLLKQATLYENTDTHQLIACPIRLDIEQFCQRFMADYQFSANNIHGLQWKFDLSDRWIFLDEKLFEQILDNLLSNAIKFSPQGGIIHLTLFAQANQLSLTLQDSGIGIPVEDLAEICEPFYRASNVCNTFPGIGLGLAVVKEIVELLAGDITFYSEVGTGTIVTVRLPLGLD
ncbi:MAG: PAS domain S-box protein [Scytolyngbya sp. HA4215-MV1]|jgi:PAS domain S-box-containing protein|nr:PAS domain S-box protein [Scytolyngbya sp. HA4215-MV1]